MTSYPLKQTHKISGDAKMIYCMWIWKRGHNHATRAHVGEKHTLFYMATSTNNFCRTGFRLGRVAFQTDSPIIWQHSLAGTYSIWEQIWLTNGSMCGNVGLGFKNIQLEKTPRTYTEKTRWLAGCLAGWLAGWLAGLMAGWLASWLTGWQTGWLLTGRLVGCWLAG